jgi:hypothetical protein
LRRVAAVVAASSWVTGVVAEFAGLEALATGARQERLMLRVRATH